MSRFPCKFDQSYLEHERRQRLERILALGPLVYGNCGHVTVIQDRDPGDEDDGPDTSK